MQFIIIARSSRLVKHIFQIFSSFFDLFSNFFQKYFAKNHNLQKCYKKVPNGHEKVSNRFSFEKITKKRAFFKKVFKNLLQNKQKCGMICKCMDELGSVPSHAHRSDFH